MAVLDRAQRSLQMSSIPAGPQETTSTPLTQIRDEKGVTQSAIAWSGFFFALLQSICTFFTALSGLRLVIGISSFALSAGVTALLDRLHADWIRIPMIGLALIGTLLNLVIVAQLRRLRNRPSSQWRQIPLSPHKIRMERAQVILSIVTLVLLAVEEYLHFRWRHHF
jgi:hypothetical protein